MTIQVEWSATNPAGGTALGTARRFGNIGLFKPRTYDEQRATSQKPPKPVREASPKEPSDRKRASSFLLSLSRSSLTSNHENNRTRASSANRDSRSSLSGSPVWRSGSFSSSQSSLRRRHSENDRTKSSPYNSNIRFVGTTSSRDSVASQRPSDIALEKSRHNPPSVVDDKESALKRRIKEVEEAYGRLKRSNPQLNEVGTQKPGEKVSGSDASVAKQNYVTSSNGPAKPRGNLKQSILDRLTPRSRTPERATSNTDTSTSSYPFGSAALSPPIQALYDDSHSHPDTNRTHHGDILPRPPASTPPARKEQEIAYHYHHPRRLRHSQDVIEKSLSKAQLRNATIKDLNNAREGRIRRANSEGYDFEARSQMPGLTGDQRPRARSFHVSRSHVDRSHVLPSNPEILKLLSMDTDSRRRALQYTVKRQHPPRGLVGLQNLGNTCFMNSILQCAFSTELLVGYFLSGDYKSDINPRSPMKGQLATGK
ncbi:hypothetical protein SpCBS45565_g01591 [Spizellomyces sp. 'palustris']|nr:hypothetical protein SpCBS45565_g01591 [Spizellomyces sp. 'palustris']